MNIENYFEQEKGITVDAARNAGARYTAIDICKFAKKYHESEVKNLSSNTVLADAEVKIEVKITDSSGTKQHEVSSPLLDDFKLKRLIWEEWEDEIKEEDPREMVFKYMKMMKDAFINGNEN